MDLIDTINYLSNRLATLQDRIQTEEATKNALVMPIIQALGYDVFNPLEVVPEFTADVGTKKGEKIDYAIMMAGEPIILIECKSSNSVLSLENASQLYRYFGVTEARIAVLTNGIEYRIYTDIEASNKMDSKPFFEFSITSIEEKEINELKKYSKNSFDLDVILSTASELKYKKQIRQLLTRELENPSEEFVRLFAKQVYDGLLTTEKKAQFKTLVSHAFREWLNSQIKNRLQSAITNSAKGEEEEAVEEVEQSVQGKDGIVTTPEEIEGFQIVRAILAKEIEPERIFMRDTKSYCGILLDDNNRKPICRFVFTSVQKTLVFLDKDRKEERVSLSLLTDIFKHSDKLIESAKSYL